MRRFLAPVLLFIAACTEQSTAPGVCPNFCPVGSIDIQDTVLIDAVERDTAFRGYVQSFDAPFMAVSTLPTVIDSRAIFRMTALFTTRVVGTDTIPIQVDSARLRLIIARRDTNAENLVVKLYRMPLTIDTTTTFGDVLADFGTTPVDSVNLNELLAQPLIGDSATIAQWGDSIRTDSEGHVVRVLKGADTVLALFFDLNTTEAPFVVDDTGKLAWGVRVTAATRPSILIDARGERDPELTWFYHYTIPDTVSTEPDSVANEAGRRTTEFHNFVFDPPSPLLDDNLAVGGVPSARSLLRVAIPSLLRDSADVVRATLLLVPVSPLQGSPGDSIALVAHPVAADLGAKSPLTTVDAFNGFAMLQPGSTDTVRIEMSDLIRNWAMDTTAVTAFVLRVAPEASFPGEIRFFSSRTAFRPTLQVTFVKRFAFGTR